MLPAARHCIREFVLLNLPTHPPTHHSILRQIISEYSTYNISNARNIYTVRKPSSTVAVAGLRFTMSCQALLRDTKTRVVACAEWKLRAKTAGGIWVMYLKERVSRPLLMPGTVSTRFLSSLSPIKHPAEASCPRGPDSLQANFC